MSNSASPISQIATWCFIATKKNLKITLPRIHVTTTHRRREISLAKSENARVQIEVNAAARHRKERSVVRDDVKGKFDESCALVVEPIHTTRIERRTNYPRPSTIYIYIYIYGELLSPGVISRSNVLVIRLKTGSTLVRRFFANLRPRRGGGGPLPAAPRSKK